MTAHDHRTTDEEKEELTCSVCGKQGKTVSIRICGYIQEIHEREVLEVICDACEHEHLMDI